MNVTGQMVKVWTVTLREAVGSRGRLAGVFESESTARATAEARGWVAPMIDRVDAIRLASGELFLVTPVEMGARL